MTRFLPLALALLSACGSSQKKDEEKGPLVHRFENPEEWAKVFDDPARNAWQKPEEVIRLLEIGAGMKVADLGAGTGYFEPHLSRAVGETGQVLALDVEKSMVRYLTDRAQKEGLKNVSARLVKFDDPLLPNGEMDRVLIVDTWHHIPDRGKYAAKLAAGLKPDGRVMIVDYTLESEKGPPKEHRVMPDAIIKELAEGGLAGEVVTEDLPEQFVVVARRK